MKASSPTTTPTAATPPSPVAIPIEPPGSPGGRPMVRVCFHASAPRAMRRRPSGAPSEVDRIEAMLSRLVPYEAALLGWISASPGNARLFVTDPLRALDEAPIGLPEGLRTGIRALADGMSRQPAAT